MATQTTMGFSLGSGQDGEMRLKRYRESAKRNGQGLSEWCRTILDKFVENELNAEIYSKAIKK
jgi:hypothetical protein